LHCICVLARHFKHQQQNDDEIRVGGDQIRFLLAFGVELNEYYLEFNFDEVYRGIELYL
jgi:hypothetical protein